MATASTLAEIKKSKRYRNSISTESPIVMLTPPNPEEVVREERRLSMDSVHSAQSSASQNDKDKDDHLVPPKEAEPEEIVAKLIKQRRPSTITNLSNTIKQIFIEKKMKEDGVPALIVDGLYLGSVGAAKNVQWLKSHQVTHVLCVAGGIGACFPKQFIYHIVEINDAADEDISCHFKECYDFIEGALNKGGKCLIHCFAGMSRSVTVTAAYLMQKQHIGAIDALKLVKKARAVANPNAGFIVQLIKFQKENENETVIINNHEVEEKLAQPMETNQMVQEWETGRRPSLFTALAKLRGIKHRSRMESTESTDSEKKETQLGLHPALALDNVKLQLLKEVSDESDSNCNKPQIGINIESLAVDKEDEEDVVTPLESVDHSSFPNTTSL